MAIKKAKTLAIKAPLTIATRGTELLGQLDAVLGRLPRNLDTLLGRDWRQTFVHVIFGSFVGGLALLLILLYAGVPIVGGS
jgi:hypothetical protein